MLNSSAQQLLPGLRRSELLIVLNSTEDMNWKLYKQASKHQAGGSAGSSPTTLHSSPSSHECTRTCVGAWGCTGEGELLTLLRKKKMETKTYKQKITQERAAVFTL